MPSEDLRPGGVPLHFAVYWAVWAALVVGTWRFVRVNRGRTGRGRLVAGNALVFATLLSTAVALAETYLRYFYDESDQYGLTMTNADWFRRHLHLDSQGFRDRELTDAKAPGIVRVACVGDSFTMGWGVKDARDAFPQRIGAALDARFPGRFEVWNLGEPGLSTGDEMKLLDDVSGRSSLDRVVLGYCLNDPDDLLPHDRVFDRLDAPRLPLINPEWSYVADFLWFRLRLRDDPRVRNYFAWEKEAYDDPEIWGRQCDRFAHIADRCSAKAIRLDVVVFPFFSEWGPNYRFNSCHDRVVDAWKRLGVDAIDLRDAYRGIPAGDLVVNRFDAHPNERAHEIAARTILDRTFGVR